MISIVSYRQGKFFDKSSKMSASRHISSGGIPTRIVKSSPKLKPRNPKAKTPLDNELDTGGHHSLKTTQTVRNGNAKIIVDNGFQAKKKADYPVKSPQSSKYSQRKESSSTRNSRKQSPLQRRASAASTPSPSAPSGSRRPQEPPSQPGGVASRGRDAASSGDEGGDRGQNQAEAYQPLGRIDARKIMEQINETDVCKVYDVDLHATHLTTINNLDQFINMRILDLSCNHIKNIENLSNNKDLRDLKLYDNKITAIANLERLSELCALQLQHNKIRVIGKGLALARKLKTLRLDSNCIGKIEARELAACSQLSYLDISTNKIESLNALNALSSLEELRATHNCLRALTDLKRCKKLQEIDVSNNKIADISGLRGLHNLTVLRISHNYLTSDHLKAVEKLRSLHTLDISHNKVSEVDFIPALFPDLEVLNVSSNRIASWQSVVSLHKCQHLSELYLHGNPFAEPDGEKPSYHQELQATLLTLDILDGAMVKRPTASKAPLMRPMSASTVVSARQVENQLKNADQDLSSFMTSLSDRFENLRMMLDTLPSEPPRQHPLSAASDDLSVRSVSAMSDGRPGSRCNSRSRIANAKAFASQHF